MKLNKMIFDPIISLILRRNFGVFFFMQIRVTQMKIPLLLSVISNWSSFVIWMQTLL